MSDRSDGNRSYKADYEDVLILLAWEGEELTEGQVAKALGCDRVTARYRRIKAKEHGAYIGGERWKQAKEKSVMAKELHSG